MAVDDPQLSRRERKTQRTRRAIVRAASELVLEDGYARATIARIAERADLATATVTTRFASKEDIFLEGGDRVVALAEQHLSARSGDVVDRLEAWVEDVIRLEAVEPRDPEIRLLRARAVGSDPDLQALRVQHMNRAHHAIADAVARDTRQRVDAPGPQLFAAAAIAMLGAADLMAATEPTTDVRSVLRHGFHVLRTTLRALVDAPA